MELPELARRIQLKYHRVGGGALENAVGDPGNGVGRDRVRERWVCDLHEVVMEVTVREHIGIGKTHVQMVADTSGYGRKDAVEYPAM